jgi:hypothetical protein
MTVVRVKGFNIFRDRFGHPRCYHRKTGTPIDLKKVPIGSELSPTPRYQASGFVRWRIPEMPPAATDGRLRLQSGPRQATKSPQTRIPSGAAARG